MIDGVAYTDGRQNSRSRNVLKLYRVLARAGAAKANSPQRHGEAGGPEVWAQPRYPGREPVRTAPSTAVQDRVEGWSFLCRAAAEHQPHLPGSMGRMRSGIGRQPQTQAKLVCLKCGLSANADSISALNIREASLACSQPWHAVSASWQEPTEGIHRLGVEPVGIPGL